MQSQDSISIMAESEDESTNIPRIQQRLPKADQWHHAKKFNRIERKQLCDRNQYIYFQTALIKQPDPTSQYRMQIYNMFTYAKFHILFGEGNIILET